MRDLDEFERGFVQTAFEVFVPFEVAVGLFYYDMPLE
jgi:hypothetical protein